MFRRFMPCLSAIPKRFAYKKEKDDPINIQMNDSDSNEQFVEERTVISSLPSASLPSASLPSASLPSASLPSASLPITNAKWKDCRPFVAPITEGYVLKVYDGDTITIAFRLPYEGSALYRSSVRLNGIDAPEIKGKNEDEKKAAQLAKRSLETLILDKTITLKNIQTEKYGRILADVYIGDIHVNQWLLDNKLVVRYDGGTKKSPESWLEYNES
jgi:micrococcal nuclease